MSEVCSYFCLFFFKRKTAYEMRISDWSSDVCSSDLSGPLSNSPERHSAAPSGPRQGVACGDLRDTDLRSRNAHSEGQCYVRVARNVGSEHRCDHAGRPARPQLLVD